jgi:phosphatidylserine/phosphatidylglycerophosphate/cardiolipin synthase-like enzyme
MRSTTANDFLTARAIAGKYVVFLAWDLLDWAGVEQSKLLGFAIERSELKADGNVLEKTFLQGVKRFPGRELAITPGTPASTLEHPVQAFQWGDYTAKPGRGYVYRIVPMVGAPQRLEPDNDNALTLAVRTQDEWLGAPPGEDRPAHSVHFNRGVAGSQAYARKFGKIRPDEDDPESTQMRWLSRNVFEAITGFIGCAADDNHGLRGAFYEFQYLPVLRALRAAAERQVDVHILYEAEEYKEKNEAAIAAAALGAVCTPHRVRSGIRHNKFLVLLKNGAPVAVMTGSTNISAGGIFGHSNVLHIVWDRGVAASYLAYWERLSQPDVDTRSLKTFSKGVSGVPPVLAPGACVTLFSPRDGEDARTLNWYAERFKTAGHLACMSFAFGVSAGFERVLNSHDKVVRYALFDKAIKADVADSIRANVNSMVACGARLGPGDLENFIGERLTGFNKNAYIHDKFLLCDPLGAAPLVVTGSANFSPASQQSNDENMLVIAADTEVADAYFGEFMRIFDHLYVRYVIGLLKKEGKGDPQAGFLKESPAAWLAPQRGERKRIRREAFLA